MLHNWCLNSSALTADVLEKFIAQIETNNEFMQGAIGHPDSSVIDENYRSCKVQWVNNPAVHSFVWNCILDVNRLAFGFDIQVLPAIQYTVYNSDSQDHYNWHRDTYFTHNAPYDRKLTFVMQLSNSDEYEGGDLLLEDDFFENKPDRDEFRRKGAVFIFPSFIKHKVTPVTKGTRKTLVAWAEGPKFR